jgi:hypothetical protein
LELYSAPAECYSGSDEWRHSAIYLSHSAAGLENLAAWGAILFPLSPKMFFLFLLNAKKLHGIWIILLM